jgi:hypothetical protein
MINLKAIEDAVFEDVKAILAKKPGAARPCQVIAQERFPGDTPEALLSQLAYVALAQAIAPEIIKALLAKAQQAKATSEAAKEADKADAAAADALAATKLTEDVIARAKAKAKKKAA